MLCALFKLELFVRAVQTQFLVLSMVRYILLCLSFDFDLCHFFFTCSLLNFNDTSKHSLVSWILLLLFFFFFFF